MDDYDSEIEYDDEFDKSMKMDKSADFKTNYDPLKFGVKQNKMQIVLEYELKLTRKRF